MNIMPATASFTFIHRDDKGKPDRIYPWDSAVTTYLAASINICRGMLNQDIVRAAFTKFLIDSKKADKVPGREDIPPEQIAGTFIDAILRDWPLVFVDDSLRNQGQVARGVRRPWDDPFVTRNLAIVLNGSRVRDMCHAAKMAQEVNLEYSPQTKRFRGFMFLFANVFMHELGHLFTTFLYKGRRNTPTYIYGAMMGVSEGSHSYGGSRNYGHPRVASEPARGEAGRKLEELLFGGLTCFYRQPITEDERQPGVPYLATNKDIRQITEDSINETLLHRFHSYETSHFPLTACLHGLGDDQPPAEPISDPLSQKETAKLLRSDPNPRKILVGSDSNLYRIPVQGWVRGLRVQAEDGETGRRSDGFWDY